MEDGSASAGAPVSPEQPVSVEPIEQRAALLYPEVMQTMPKIEPFRNAAADSAVRGAHQTRFQLPGEQGWFEFRSESHSNESEKELFLEHGELDIDEYDKSRDPQDLYTGVGFNTKERLRITVERDYEAGGYKGKSVEFDEYIDGKRQVTEDPNKINEFWGKIKASASL